MPCWASVAASDLSMPFEAEQVVGNLLELLLGDDGLGQQHIARTIARLLVDRVLVEGLDLSVSESGT